MLPTPMLQRHCESVHPETRDWSNTEKNLFLEQAKCRNKQIQQSLTQTRSSRKLPHLASYKLGITLAKHQKPLTFGETVIEWVIASDPSKLLLDCTDV